MPATTIFNFLFCSHVIINLNPDPNPEYQPQTMSMASAALAFGGGGTTEEEVANIKTETAPSQSQSTSLPSKKGDDKNMASSKSSIDIAKKTNSGASSKSPSPGKKKKTTKTKKKASSNSNSNSALASPKSAEELQADMDETGAVLEGHIADDVWPEEYEKLKGRLKRLRVRFYKNRKADKNGIEATRENWHIPRKWMEKESKSIRAGLHSLRDLTIQFHMVKRDPNALRWAEAKEWEHAYHARSSASKMFKTVPEVNNPDEWITGEDQEQRAKARGVHPPVFGNKMRLEIAEMERIVENLQLIQFISQSETDELLRLNAEDAIMPKPEQTKKQETQIFRRRKPRSAALQLAHEGNLFEYVKFNEMDSLRKAVEERVSTGNNRADVVNTKQGFGKETPLHIAAGMGHLDAMIYLLESDADTESLTGFGWTSLHYAASFPISKRGSATEALDRAQCVETLIRAGANVNARIDKGFTDYTANLAAPLHFAAHANCVPIVKLLVEAGAVINTFDCNGRSPLAIAARSDSSDVVNYLMSLKGQYTANLDKRDYWLVSATDEIQAMKERAGAPALVPEDRATPALYDALGSTLGDLTGRETTPRANPATHFEVQSIALERFIESDPAFRLDRSFFHVNSEERLGNVYKALVAQEHIQVPPIPRPCMYEYIGPKTTFVVDWKERFPLLVPPEPTRPRQSLVQCVQYHLRRALPAAKIDCFIFQADERYRQYYPNVVVPRPNLYRLHEWLVEQLEMELRGCGVRWSMRTQFAYLPLIGCNDIWPTDGGGSKLPYNYVGHFDEFGLRIHDQAPEPARMRWLTTLRKDQFPVNECAELSNEMEQFVKELRKKNGRAPYKLTL